VRMCKPDYSLAKKAIENVGLEILSDKGMRTAFLMDIFPDDGVKKDVINRILDENSITLIQRICLLDNNTAEIERLNKKWHEKLWMTKGATDFAWEFFLSVFERDSLAYDSGSTELVKDIVNDIFNDDIFSEHVEFAGVAQGDSPAESTDCSEDFFLIDKQTELSEAEQTVFCMRAENYEQDADWIKVSAKEKILVFINISSLCKHYNCVMVTTKSIGFSDNIELYSTLVLKRGKQRVFFIKEKIAVEKGGSIWGYFSTNDKTPWHEIKPNTVVSDIQRASEKIGYIIGRDSSGNRWGKTGIW